MVISTTTTSQQKPRPELYSHSVSQTQNLVICQCHAKLSIWALLFSGTLLAVVEQNIQGLMSSLLEKEWQVQTIGKQKACKGRGSALWRRDWGTHLTSWSNQVFWLTGVTQIWITIKYELGLEVKGLKMCISFLTVENCILMLSKIIPGNHKNDIFLLCYLCDVIKYSVLQLHCTNQSNY